MIGDWAMAWSTYIRNILMHFNNEPFRWYVGINSNHFTLVSAALYLLLELNYWGIGQ